MTTKGHDGIVCTKIHSLVLTISNDLSSHEVVHFHAVILIVTRIVFYAPLELISL